MRSKYKYSFSKGLSILITLYFCITIIIPLIINIFKINWKIVPDIIKSTIFFTVFTMMFTDYGVALILIIPALLTFIIDIKIKEVDIINQQSKIYLIKKNKIRDSICWIFCAIIASLVIIPLISYIFIGLVENYPINMQFSLKHIQQVLSMKLGKYLRNSIIVALNTALIGTMLAYMMAYVTINMKIK